MTDLNLPALLEVNQNLRTAMSSDRSLTPGARISFYEAGLEEEVQQLFQAQRPLKEHILPRLELFAFFYDNKFFLQQNAALRGDDAVAYKRIAAKTAFAYGFAAGLLTDNPEGKAGLESPQHYDSCLRKIYRLGEKIGGIHYLLEQQEREGQKNSALIAMDQKSRTYSGEISPHKPPQQQR